MTKLTVYQNHGAPYMTRDTETLSFDGETFDEALSFLADWMEDYPEQCHGLAAGFWPRTLEVWFGLLYQDGQWLADYCLETRPLEGGWPAAKSMFLQAVREFNYEEDIDVSH